MTTVAVEARGVVTPERFARGMSIEQYLDFIGTPENLAREAGWWLGPQRHDFSGPLRARFSGVPMKSRYCSMVMPRAKRSGVTTVCAWPARTVIFPGRP